MTSDARIIIEGLRQFSLDRVRQLALNIQAGLIEDTPVDTGWARANWVASVGQPSTGPVGSRGSVSYAEQQASVGVLASMTRLETIYISNHVPYIQALNEGHSAQAPSGFIQLRIDREVSALR